MEDIRSVIAENITALRQAHGMTQAELAERLNYSDKAVSKWERAESMPDVAVLVSLADVFGVTLDYLVSAEHPVADASEPVPASAPQGEPEKAAEPAPENTPAGEKNGYRHGVIIAVSVLLVWFIALAVFVMISLLAPGTNFGWLAFLYAFPIAAVVWLVLNSVWFDPRWNYLIVSLLVWSILAAVQLSLSYFGIEARLIYLLGVPGQIVIILWSQLFRKVK